MPVVVEYVLSVVDCIYLFFTIVSEYLTMELAELVQWEYWDYTIKTFTSPFGGMTWSLRLFPDVVNLSIESPLYIFGQALRVISDVMAEIMMLFNVPPNTPVYVGIFYIGVAFFGIYLIVRYIVGAIPNLKLI